MRFRLLAIFLVIFLAHLFPATAAFAGNISYPQDSYIFSSTNNITLTVRAGSAADAVVVSASTINVTLAANDTFELIEPGSRHLPNTQGLPECTVDAQGNHLVMGPFVGTTTIVVTPSLVDCGGSSGNGGSGGIVITYPNDDTGSDEADGKENTNANSPISINDNANANDNENNNVNQQENTNANTNSDVEQSNANVPINIPLTNDGVGAGNSNTPGGQGTAIGAPVVVTPGDGTVIAITQPTISGTAMPNTQVDVLVDAQLVGSALSSAAGIWSLPLPQALLSGGHLVVAVANGVQSAPVQFVIDVTPPLAPAIVDAKLLSTQFVSGKIYDTSFFVSGIAPEQEDILFSFDGGTALKGLSTQAGAWQTTLYATLTEGDHMLAVQAVDLLGNVSAATLLPFRVPLVGNAPQALQVIATGTPPVVILIPECSDGKDNDGDGWVDFPADAGCRSREGNDEASDKRSALSALQGLIPGLAPLFAPIAAVIEHPVVQQLNQTIAAPTALVIVSANAAAALPELGFLTYLRFLFLQPLLLFRRRRRGWGTVYNSMTKLPVDLAIVRLYDTAKHRLLRTTVTDRNGRFLFFVPPGAYRLEVTKPQFVFPSTYVQGKTADAQYANVYSGAMFTLKNTAMIAPNIPIDPHMREKPDREVLRDAMKQKLHTVFSSLGIFLAAGIWFVSPTVVNTIALAVHVGLFFLFRRLARGFMPKTWGVISDLLHRKPLAASVVRIFEPTYHRLLETQVTDPSGKYAFLVGRNRYYLTVAKQGYKPAKSGLLDLTTGPDRAVVAENVAMEPVPESGPAAQTPATQTVVPASETSASATQHVTESPVDVKK